MSVRYRDNAPWEDVPAPEPTVRLPEDLERSEQWLRAEAQTLGAPWPIGLRVLYEGETWIVSEQRFGERYILRGPRAQVYALLAEEIAPLQVVSLPVDERRFT